MTRRGPNSREKNRVFIDLDLEVIACRKSTLTETGTSDSYINTDYAVLSQIQVQEKETMHTS